MQTIYTQIAHGDGCPGCFNVTYENGDDATKTICNECGYVEGYNDDAGEMRDIKSRLSDLVMEECDDLPTSSNQSEYERIMVKLAYVQAKALLAIAIANAEKRA